MTPDDLELLSLQSAAGLSEQFVQQVKDFLHADLDPEGSIPTTVSAVLSCVESVCEKEKEYEVLYNV